MNTEFLKKLIKLANNNPNDNEANSAARKVCKIIEDENFKSLSESTYLPPNPFYGTDILSELMNQLRKPKTQYASSTNSEHEIWPKSNNQQDNNYYKKCPFCQLNTLEHHSHSYSFICSNCKRELTELEYYAKSK